MEPWHVVELLVLAVVSLVSSLLMKSLGDHSKRISELEKQQYTRADAAAGRAELKREIEKVQAGGEEHRKESNQMFGRVFDALDDIKGRLPAKER